MAENWLEIVKNCHFVGQGGLRIDDEYAALKALWFLLYPFILFKPNLILEPYDYYDFGTMRSLNGVWRFGLLKKKV